MPQFLADIHTFPRILKPAIECAGVAFEAAYYTRKQVCPVSARHARDRVEMVGHHDKRIDAQPRIVRGVRKPGVAHRRAQPVQGALLPHDRAEHALVQRDLDGDEKPSVTIIDVWIT